MRMSLLLCLITLVSCNSLKNQDFEPVSQQFQEEMLDLVNKKRAEGCTCGNTYFGPTSSLSWNSNLETAASRHAQDMQQNSFFDHKGSDGTRVANRVTDTGYNWKAVGENIAFGYSNMAQAVQGWIDSPTHCELLMSPDFKEMGGAQAGTYWVQTFGTSMN